MLPSHRRAIEEHPQLPATAAARGRGGSGVAETCDTELFLASVGNRSAPTCHTRADQGGLGRRGRRCAGATRTPHHPSPCPGNCAQKMSANQRDGMACLMRPPARRRSFELAAIHVTSRQRGVLAGAAHLDPAIELQPQRHCLVRRRADLQGRQHTGIRHGGAKVPGAHQGLRPKLSAAANSAR